MIQNFGSSLAGWSGSGCLLMLQSRCWPGLQSCETLTEAARPTSGLVHSHGWHIGAGCWQEVYCPHYMDLSLRLSECLQYMAANFPQRSQQMIQEIKMEAMMSFMTPPWKSHTIISTISYWLLQSALFIVGGGCISANTGSHLESWLPQWLINSLIHTLIKSPWASNVKVSGLSSGNSCKRTKQLQFYFLAAYILVGVGKNRE